LRNGRLGSDYEYNEVADSRLCYNSDSGATVVMITTMEEPMTEPERKTMPVRLGLEAIEAAKIAGSLKGLSLAEYATAVLLERANRDIDEFSQARALATAKKGKKSESDGK
jgi:hypothetical protein